MEDIKRRLIETLQNNRGSIARSSVKWAPDTVLEELKKERKIDVIKRGNGFTIKLLADQGTTLDDSTKKEKDQESQKGEKTQIEDILKLLNEINKKLDTLLQRNGSPNLDFDKVFDEVKNPMGVATLKDIREKMGLSKEQFYSKYASHIQSSYKLFRGGEEGIVENGVIFGIIRR